MNTLDFVDCDGIDGKGMSLLFKLNTTTEYGQKSPAGSIMESGDFCKHDDGRLCECRLQVIADWDY